MIRDQRAPYPQNPKQRDTKAGASPGWCAVQGKTLLLITNSDYQYTDVMMSHCYDRFLPQGMRWRDLFDMARLGG